MSVTRDIIETWRRPYAVVRRQLALGPREDRALAYLMAGLGVIFIAQLPRLSREVQLGGTASPDLSQLAGYSFFGLLIVWPLLMYAIAALAHLIIRLLRGSGPAFGTRMAIFWALLASAPAALLDGLARGLLGPGAASTLTGVIWLAALFIFTVVGLKEAHWPAATERQRAIG